MHEPNCLIEIEVGAKHAQLAILEDMVIGYLNMDPYRIPSIRDSQDLNPIMTFLHICDGDKHVGCPYLNL